MDRFEVANYFWGSKRIACHHIDKHGHVPDGGIIHEVSSRLGDGRLQRTTKFHTHTPLRIGDQITDTFSPYASLERGFVSEISNLGKDAQGVEGYLVTCKRRGPISLPLLRRFWWHK